MLLNNLLYKQHNSFYCYSYFNLDRGQWVNFILLTASMQKWFFSNRHNQRCNWGGTVSAMGAKSRRVTNLIASIIHNFNYRLSSIAILFLICLEWNQLLSASLTRIPLTRKIIKVSRIDITFFITSSFYLLLLFVVVVYF